MADMMIDLRNQNSAAYAMPSLEDNTLVIVLGGGKKTIKIAMSEVLAGQLAQSISKTLRPIPLSAPRVKVLDVKTNIPERQG